MPENFSPNHELYGAAKTGGDKIAYCLKSPLWLSATLRQPFKNMTSNSMTSEALRLKGWKEIAGGKFERIKTPRAGETWPAGWKPEEGTNKQTQNVTIKEGKVVASRRVRQSSKPLMNRLETEFHQLLLADHVAAHIRIQSVKLKIGNGVAYTIDFFNFVDRIAHEVKGEWCVDDSIVKLKVAAAMYPEIKFVLAWKGKNKEWQRQAILP